MFNATVKYSEDEYNSLSVTGKNAFWQFLNAKKNQWCPTHENCPLFSNAVDYESSDLVDKLEFWSRYDSYFNPSLIKKTFETKSETKSGIAKKMVKFKKSVDKARSGFAKRNTLNRAGFKTGSNPDGCTQASCHVVDSDLTKDFTIDASDFKEQAETGNPIVDCKRCCEDVTKEWNKECAQLHKVIANKLQQKGCPAVLIPYQVEDTTPQLQHTVIPTCTQPQQTCGGGTYYFNH